MQKVVKHATDSKHRLMLESHRSITLCYILWSHCLTFTVNRRQTVSVRNEYYVDARSLQNNIVARKDAIYECKSRKKSRNNQISIFLSHGRFY